jgi:hypothetical protein
MARIRSIYPNTPTDPEFAALPIPARLLFIYSWTIADDAGNLERNPRGMKMTLFPGDETMNVRKIIRYTDALIEGRFFLPYQIDGKAFLHVRNFKKYQKPRHPTGPRHPLFPGQLYTYHVRQGNKWISFMVKGESTGNVPGTYREHTGNVPAGFDLDLGSSSGTGEDQDPSFKKELKDLGDPGGGDNGPDTDEMIDPMREVDAEMEELNERVNRKHAARPRSR